MPSFTPNKNYVDGHKVLAWFPSPDRATVERFAKHIVAAGAGDTGYLPLFDENRLGGREIEALLFDAEIEGRGFWLDKHGWGQRRDADGNLVHFGWPVVTGDDFVETGRSRVDNDMLCDRWPELNDVGEICLTLFNVSFGPRDRGEHVAM